MLNITSLYQELNKFNDVPDTPEDIEDRILWAWAIERDKEQERNIVESFLKQAGVINYQWRC